MLALERLKAVCFASLFNSVAASKLFHTTGHATEKALSPNFVFVRGTE